MIDVTDATFETAVMVRSGTVPVVVDLWAPWCEPCKTLGPILERVVAATEGAVELAKVNVDENPQTSAKFQVQSIPAVYAVREGNVVDGFVGAVPEAKITEFVGRLAPPPRPVDLLVEAGDEASLREALEMEPDHPGAIAGLARIHVDEGRPEEALALVARIAETAETRSIAAAARLAIQGVSADADIAALLDSLLDRVRDDESVRREYLDLIETLGPEDPRATHYRKALASRLF